MYAIVDIETTGSHAAANGITEISIQIFDGNTVVERFETLINPLQTIPRFIQAMTGITDEMVENAPLFEQVADKIYTLLKDKVFVAHNVNFDYSFVKASLAEAGYEFNCPKLCTVRLSRKLIPGLPSYSLGKLCHSLGITITNQHRAGGDTDATLKVFDLLLKKDKNKFIEKSLARNSKENILPPNVPKEHFEKLPFTPGVYYFHNEKGKIIYVGKAKNIRYRVNSHFSTNSQSRQRQNFLRHTYAISYQDTATELMACILESTEIKKLWPVFNYSQKRWEDTYGIYDYVDQNGYLRLAIEKNKRQLTPVCTFHNITEGHTILRRIIRDFDLCPKFCFLQTSDGDCEGSCHGACMQSESAKEYNTRVEQAMESLNEQATYAIIESGLQAEEQSCILVWKGKFYGMGYIPSDTQITQPEDLKGLLTPYKESLFIRNLVNNYAARHPAKVRSFQPQSIH